MSDVNDVYAGIDEWCAALESGSVVLELDESVVDSTQEERAVLLHFARGQYYGLNQVATTVWRMLGEQRPFAAIVVAITEEYDVTPETARHDTAALLRALCDRGLVTEKRG